MENERTGTGRDGETKFSGASGDRESSFYFPVQLTTGRIGNYFWLILSLLDVMSIRIIHTTLNNGANNFPVQQPRGAGLTTLSG